MDTSQLNVCYWKQFNISLIIDFFSPKLVLVTSSNCIYMQNNIIEFANEKMVKFMKINWTTLHYLTNHSLYVCRLLSVYCITSSLMENKLNIEIPSNSLDWDESVETRKRRKKNQRIKKPRNHKFYIQTRRFRFDPHRCIILRFFHFNE